MYSHDTPVVVLNLSASGIAIIRSLRRQGIQVHAFDIKSRYEIGRTRHAKCGICPHPAKEEEALLGFLIQLGKTFPHKAVLYACSDDFCRFISKHRETLYAFYRFIMPEHSLIEESLDKRAASLWMERYHIPGPQSFVFSNEEELEAIVDQVKFPCILKPAFSLEFRSKISKKAIMVETAEELRPAFREYSRYGELMIQEYIPGGDECIFSLHAYLDDNLRPIGLYTKQKLHQFPAYLGTGCYCVSVADDEVIRAGLELLKQLKFKGFSIVEFKKDPRDGKPKFIELGCRTGLSNWLSAACGVDLAYLYYLSVTGQNPEPATKQKEGVKWVYLTRMVLTYLEKRKRGDMTLKELLSILFEPKVEALWAWDDPMPFLRSLTSHIRNAWKQSAGRGKSAKGEAKV